MAGYLVFSTFEADTPPDLPGAMVDLDCETSVWRALDAGRTTVLQRFADQPSAEAQIARLVESDPSPALKGAVPDIKGLSLEEEGGKPLGSPDGKYLSVVRFVVSPGHGDEIGEQMAEFLPFLASAPGYLGHVRAVNVALPEEIWTLAIWNALPLTPPEDEDFTFEVYERV